MEKHYGLLPGLAFLKGFSSFYSLLLAYGHKVPMFYGVAVLDGVTVYKNRSQGALQVDSRSVEWQITFDLGSIMVSSLESVEIYRRTAEVPIEFGGGNAACGVLVVWTRR